MKRNGFFLQIWIRLSLALLLTEGIFRVISFQTAADASAVKIVVFVMASASFLTGLLSFLPVKAGLFLADLSALTAALFAMLQMGMKNMMGNYTSLRAGQDMLGRVTEYVPLFLKALKPSFYTVLLPPALMIFINFRYPPEKENEKTVSLLGIIISMILGYSGRVMTEADGQTALYRQPKYIEKSLKEFGLITFLVRDLLSVTQKEELMNVEIKPEETGDAQKTEETVLSEETPLPERHREIDDTKWKQISEAETDETMKTIDQYLMNREITDCNDMTGILKGKNLIYIMIEAFDYIAVDPDLTPTLYMMKEDGWDFTRHYTPKYSCTTGESEFISEVSLIPESDVCTPNEYADNAFPQSIFQIFANEGYFSSAYHNWKDEFYDRRKLYANSGCQLYLNHDDQDYEQLWGWPSDYEMMELTIPEYIDKERFFTLYVTSTTHFPYDADSDLGTRYLGRVNEVHPDYPMNIKRYLSKAIELDRAMAYLLEQLKVHNRLEETAILFFADHHPLKTDLQEIAEYTYEIDRTEGLNIDRTPFVIYSPVLGKAKQNGVNSTFDILPTILNMYDMNFDPRLYLGTDYFSDKEKVVYFPDGNWISEHGIYYIGSGTFVPFEEGAETDESYVSSMNAEISNLFALSSMIYRSDYFASREFVTRPESKEDMNR